MSSSETTSDSQNSHSLNEKKIDSKEDNYRRDSFDDRFCDDLCEEILQYLSLEDKFRLEYVSKQFQRTVFKRLNEYNLDDGKFHWFKHSDVWVTHKLVNLVKKFERLDCLQKLKSLSLTLRYTDLRQLLPELKAFPALKILQILTDIHYWRIEGIPIGYKKFYFSKLFTFEAFKGLSNITHLTLCLNLWEYSDKKLNEKLLKDIDINLPNLQYLRIIDNFKTTPEGVTQMADILSRLSRLETLELFCKSGVDFKPIEEQITKMCRKIKEIEIESHSVIDLDNYIDFYLENDCEDFLSD